MIKYVYLIYLITVGGSGVRPSIVIFINRIRNGINPGGVAFIIWPLVLDLYKSERT